MDERSVDDQIASIAALAEPVRRALYRFVVAQPGPVSREHAAAGVGVAHHVAKFNLDKLEEEGLLEVEFSRPPGRRGPGAGRPAKLYRRTTRDIDVSLPERRYDVAGELMAEAITAAWQGEPIETAVSAAARRTGRTLGAEARATVGRRPSRSGLVRTVCEVLAARGYEPRVDGRDITLANCPFHNLAKEHTELICGMNVDLVQGLVEGLGAGLEARLDPAPDRCCVTLRPV